MTIATGVADNYQDLVEKLRDFLIGAATHSSVTFSGTGTGVLGNESYAYAEGHVGMATTTVSESWTVTCNSTATVGAETWGVTGSVSGAQAGATTGVDYDNGIIKFRIEQGSTPFASGDSYSFTTSQGVLQASSEAWDLELDHGPHSGLDDKYILVKGKGTGGDEEIFVSLRMHADPSNDYYNMLIQGMSGYNAAPYTQLNPSRPVTLCLRSGAIPYWFSANTRRFVVSTKVNTVYTSAYAGLIIPYATPTQYPYPMFVAATSGDSDAQFSDTGATMNSIIRPDHHSQGSGGSDNYESSGYLRHPDGVWRPYFTDNPGSHRSIWPTCKGGPASSVSDFKLRENLDSSNAAGTNGSRTLLPCILFAHIGNPASEVYGEMDGVYWASGFNSLGSESTIDVDGTDYIMFQNVYRTEWDSFWVMRQT